MTRVAPLFCAFAFLILILSPAGDARAQATFFKTIGGLSYSEAYAITNSGDGGYVLTGRVGASFNDDVYVVRTTAFGDTVWARRLAAPGNEYGYSVCAAGDGGFVVAGFGNGMGAGENDVILLKLSATGSVLWARTIGGVRNEQAYRVQRTSDGGFIIGGYSSEAISNRFLLIRTDAAGATLWIRTYGGDAGDQAYALCQTTDGGFALAGRTSSFGGGTFKLFVVKVDAAGTPLWSRAYGGASTDEASDILPMADGGLLVAGRTFSSGAGSGDVFLVRTDAAGAVQWSRTIGGAGSEDRTSILPAAGGGYILTATTGSFGGFNDLWLVRTDDTGTPLWSRTFGGASLESAYGVALATDGGFALAGSSNSFGPGASANLALIKTDGTGGGTCHDLVTTAIAGTPAPIVTVASPFLRIPAFVNAAAAFTATSVADAYVLCSMTSGVGEGSPEPDGETRPAKLLAARPNPAPGVTRIAYELTMATRARLDIFDLSGRRVRTLADGEHAAGRHEREWDGAAADGTPLPGGHYFHVLTVSGASSGRLTGKVLLLRPAGP